MFTINSYISLKLENGKTHIYINGKRFIQCKFILLQLSEEELLNYDEIKSVDDIGKKLNNIQEGWKSKSLISPQTEFWAHCSNLQVWVENDYDTNLLHSNLAFPLLKKLAELGDEKAKIVFQEEIAKRLDKSNLNVFRYLLLSGYLSYLPDNYLRYLAHNKHFIAKLNKIVKDKPLFLTFLKKEYEEESKFLYSWKRNVTLKNILDIYILADDVLGDDANPESEALTAECYYWNIIKKFIKPLDVNLNRIEELIDLFSAHIKILSLFNTEDFFKEILIPLVINICKSDSFKIHFQELIKDRLKKKKNVIGVLSLLETIIHEGLFNYLFDKNRLLKYFNGNFFEILLKIKQKKKDFKTIDNDFWEPINFYRFLKKSNKNF